MTFKNYIKGLVICIFSLVLIGIIVATILHSTNQYPTEPIMDMIDSSLVKIDSLKSDSILVLDTLK